MRIWEQGSDFYHLSEYSGNATAPWKDQGQFYFSGRPALNALLEWLREQGQAKRVWIPAYYCDQVVYPILDRRFSCLYYDGNPQHGWILQPELFQSGDILLVNSFFGIDMLSTSIMGAIQRRGAVLIEDHSQDPYSTLAWASRADYCFASLRKTLPLPDGGVLWSPVHRPLPALPNLKPEVSVARVAAMLTKRAYLEGNFSDKALFRRWYSESETELDQSEICCMSEYSHTSLISFDVNRWRLVRAENHRTLCQSVDNRHFTFLHTDKSHLSPMGFIVLSSDATHRDNLKQFLIESNIYPAVLWPLVPEMPTSDCIEARGFAQKILFIHCDGRYNTTDMLRVAQRLNEYTPDITLSKFTRMQGQA